MDRTPKKPCKFCGLSGHFSYACFQKPKNVMKRRPIKKVGKNTKQWLMTRATWIRKNPPPIEGKYWMCYLHIHPWCPGKIDVEHLTLDHVVSRSRDPSLRFKLDNLKPACIYCNGEKGSKSLDQISREPLL
jgi:5-methylcytosine-specific restriction endonuclease McrA